LTGIQPALQLPPQAGFDAFAGPLTFDQDENRLVPGIDDRNRRRVRMCYWKQWQRPRRRIRNLLSLGVVRLAAVMTGRSRKGDWRLSKASALKRGMSNAWLKQQGLLSFRDLWVQAQGYV